MVCAARDKKFGSTPMKRTLIHDQEPLRTRKEFDGIDVYEYIIFSTPFGIHLQSEKRFKVKLGTYWGNI